MSNNRIIRIIFLAVSIFCGLAATTVLFKLIGATHGNPALSNDPPEDTIVIQTVALAFWAGMSFLAFRAYRRGSINTQNRLNGEVAAKTSAQEKATLKTTGNKTKSVSPTLFSVSLTKLYILSLLTIGIYDIYWCYKNWSGIKIAESSKISPFWRAVFQIFWIYPLFREILKYSKKQGYQDSYSVGLLATLYIVLLVVGNAMGRLDYAVYASYASTYWVGVALLIILPPFLLFPAQKAINFNNSRVTGNNNFSKHTTGGIILIIIGCVLFTIVAIGAISELSLSRDTIKPSSQTVPPSPEVIIAKAGYDSLTAQYDSCSSSLNAKKNSLNTTSQSALNAYSAEYNECENIKIKQNEVTNKYNALIGQ